MEKYVHARAFWPNGSYAPDPGTHCAGIFPQRHLDLTRRITPLSQLLISFQTLTPRDFLLCKHYSAVILDEKLTNLGKKHTELNFLGWMRKILRHNILKDPKNPCGGKLENVPDVKQPHCEFYTDIVTNAIKLLKEGTIK